MTAPYGDGLARAARQQKLQDQIARFTAAMRVLEETQAQEARAR